MTIAALTGASCSSGSSDPPPAPDAQASAASLRDCTREAVATSVGYRTDEVWSDPVCIDGWGWINACPASERDPEDGCIHAGKILKVLDGRWAVVGALLQDCAESFVNVGAPRPIAEQFYPSCLPTTTLVQVPSSASPCRADDFGPSIGGLGSPMTAGGASVFIDLPVLQTCSFNTVPAIAIRDNNDVVVTSADAHSFHDVTAPDRSFVVVTPESGATLFGEWRSVCTRPSQPLRFTVTFEDGSSLEAPLQPDESRSDVIAPTCFSNGAPSDPTLPAPSGSLVMTAGTKVPVAHG